MSDEAVTTTDRLVTHHSDLKPKKAWNSSH